ncbi:hypothetical protein [Streptomyces sp. NPDC012510]|uniref:hypothetical protein n=1 Tax=Streptomyces sp. NPDC012510 TaxID=3364838 RepID=UPI0036E24504
MPAHTAPRTPRRGARDALALAVGPSPSDDTARSQHLALTTDYVVAAARAFRAAGGRPGEPSEPSEPTGG